MFTRAELENYADVLFWSLRTSRGEKLKAGDIVLLRFDLPAMELVEHIYARLLESGLNPVLRLAPTAVMDASRFALSSFGQLLFIPPGEEELYGSLSGIISVIAPQSVEHLRSVPPEDIAVVRKARVKLQAIADRREEEGVLGWTICLYPTQALAERVGASLEEYVRMFSDACLLKRAEPAQEWKRIRQNLEDISKWLDSLKISELHVESENIDLRLTVGDRRRWIGITGHNIPSFEVYMSPDYRGTKGAYYANLASYEGGNLIRGVRLEFQDGFITDISAEVGQAYAMRQVLLDDGAGRLGEFSLTDKRFSPIKRFMAHALLDENHGGEFGNCHIALGAAHVDSFDGRPLELDRETRRKIGFNSSALHWDLVNTEDKRVTARLRSGRDMIIYEQGQFAL